MVTIHIGIHYIPVTVANNALNVITNEKLMLQYITKRLGFTMNSAETTKGQRILGGFVIKSTTNSVNEIFDSSADKVVADISYELEALCNTAHALNYPILIVCINWKMTALSISDSTSPQNGLN